MSCCCFIVPSPMVARIRFLLICVVFTEHFIWLHLHAENTHMLAAPRNIRMIDTFGIHCTLYTVLVACSTNLDTISHLRLQKRRSVCQHRHCSHIYNSKGREYREGSIYDNNQFKPEQMVEKTSFPF